MIGDSGTGDQAQYDVARQMDDFRQKFSFDFVIMLGDNIYNGHAPKDFVNKFENPYKPLLDSGVKFYAALGNHDDPNQERLYKPFNMNGERYYLFRKGECRVFCAGQQLHGSGSVELDRPKTAFVPGKMENLLLPPSPIFQRKAPRQRS